MSRGWVAKAAQQGSNATTIQGKQKANRRWEVEVVHQEGWEVEVAC
jgi:hypothetical protein